MYNYLGSYFRLPLPLFSFFSEKRKRAPFKPGCAQFNEKTALINCGF